MGCNNHLRVFHHTQKLLDHQDTGTVIFYALMLLSSMGTEPYLRFQISADPGNIKFTNPWLRLQISAELESTKVHKTLVLPQVINKQQGNRWISLCGRAEGGIETGSRCDSPLHQN
jgi:hypothetical protein